MRNTRSSARTAGGIGEIHTENPEHVFGLTINDVRLLACELTDRTKTKNSFNKATAFAGESRLHVCRKFHPKLRGSFQKFCTLYVFSLKINLFYKIHLQAFNIISIVLYQSDPTFGKVLYSCLDAFVIDAFDYSGHLI
jgi:hypothetical protein